MNSDTTDDFATLLLEEAKGFLAKYRSHREDPAAVAYLHAAMLLGYCSLEAHINNVAADFADRQELTIQEQGILQERNVELKNGQFKLTNTLKMVRIEDRFEFLYRRFQNRPLNKSERWWGLLKAGFDIRNAITHPRILRRVTEKEVTDSLKAVLEAIDVLFLAVYRKPYPGKGRQLDSSLEF